MRERQVWGADRLPSYLTIGRLQANFNLFVMCDARTLDGWMDGGADTLFFFSGRTNLTNSNLIIWLGDYVLHWRAWRGMACDDDDDDESYYALTDAAKQQAVNRIT